MKNKLLFLAILIAAEGIICALLGINASEEPLLIAGAACMCVAPVFLIFELAYGSGKLKKKLLLCSFFLLTEGILAGVLCNSTFIKVTYYVALVCLILAPLALIFGILPGRKKKSALKEPEEEETEAV